MKTLIFPGELGLGVVGAGEAGDVYCFIYMFTENSKYYRGRVGGGGREALRRLWESGQP